MFTTKTANIADLNRFNYDAKASNAKIVIVLKFGADQLRFELTEALTTQEDTDLDALIAAFVDSDPAQKLPKILDYVRPDLRHKDYRDIDYKQELTQSLIPKRTVVAGEVVKTEWYAALDGSMTPYNLVLRVDIVYARDASGFATYRTTTRTWINRDDTENSEVKVTTKYYFVNPVDMINEGFKRRKLLVSHMQIPTLVFMKEVLMPSGYNEQAVLLMAQDFLDFYEQDLGKFIENSSTITNPADPNFGKKSIVVKLEDTAADGINADFNLWLDASPPSLGGLTTIRQYLISELSI